MQAIEANAKISKEAEKNIAAIAKANENRAQKLLEADEKLAKAQRDNAMKRAGEEEKLNSLLAEQARIQEEIDKTGKNTVRARELQVESENNITAIVTERDRIAKKAIEDEAKAMKERERAQNEADERKNKAQARLNELKFNAKSTEEQVVELAKKERELIEAIAALKAGGVDSTEAEVMLLETQNVLAEKRLSIEQAIAKVQDRPKPAPEKVTAFGLGSIRGSGQFGDATDAALREIVQQNRAIAQQIVNPARGGGSFNRGEAARLEFEARNAEAEIRFRESLRRDVQMFGEEGARRNFKGDPLKFDALLQQYVTDARSLQEIQKESTSELKDLNARLSKFGFTK